GLRGSRSRFGAKCGGGAVVRTARLPSSRGEAQREGQENGENGRCDCAVAAKLLAKYVERRVPLGFDRLAREVMGDISGEVASAAVAAFTLLREGFKDDC